MRNFATKIFCINSLFVNFVIVCFVKISETTNNIFDAKFHRSVSVYIYNGVTISPKKLYYGEKEHCATFIRAYFMWGLWLGLGQS